MIFLQPKKDKSKKAADPAANKVITSHNKVVNNYFYEIYSS